MTIFSAAILLFLVIDPLGNIPFFLSAIAGIEPHRQTKVVIRELLIALAVMLAFLFVGRSLLQLLGISEPALTIAGGVVLFLIAIKMVFPAGHGSTQEDIEGEPFIVPLAIPYVAGPSVLATELLLMSQYPDRWLDWLIAIVLAWGATAIILLSASKLRGYLGKKGLIAMERLMGMVLVAIAIQMFLTGIEKYVAMMPGK